MPHVGGRRRPQDGGMTRTMKTGRRIAAVASAALVAATVLMGAAQAGATSAATPIQAHATGTIGSTDATMTALAWSGSGMATQLGTVTVAGGVLLTGPGDTCPGGLANINTFNITAPNGDTLTLTSVDVACPIAEFTVHGTGHWTVTGGTGRFA